MKQLSPQQATYPSLSLSTFPSLLPLPFNPKPFDFRLTSYALHLIYSPPEPNPSTFNDSFDFNRLSLNYSLSRSFAPNWTLSNTINLHLLNQDKYDEQCNILEISTDDSAQANKIKRLGFMNSREKMREILEKYGDGGKEKVEEEEETRLGTTVIEGIGKVKRFDFKVNGKRVMEFLERG